MDGIKITGVDLAKFIKAVYELSRPQGMGFLHARDGELSDKDAEMILNSSGTGPCVLSMDYVHGRACKMHVWKEGDDLFINRSWYDHSSTQFNALLARFNIKVTATEAHGVACNCDDCRAAR